MFGTPITFAPIISSGSVGKIVSVKMNDLFAEEIKSLQLTESVAPTTEVVSSIDITTLLGYQNDLTAPNGAYTFSSGLLYIFIKDGVFDYVNTTLFFLIGTRIGIPISSFDDHIDVPDKDLELFVKYAIRESAELQGRIVPPAIEQDIKELECKYEV